MKDRNPKREMIQELVERIVAGYAPKKVILFGSYAYGEPNEYSDIDLLIIKDTDKRPIDRWMEVKRLLRDRNERLSVSPLVYTSHELDYRLAIKDFFIQEVLEKGEVLYSREEIKADLDLAWELVKLIRQRINLQGNEGDSHQPQK
jgi:predicted nucleotidyltransferase